MREHRGTFNRNHKIQYMFIFDPIASLIVVAGVFIYFACKGSGVSSKKEERSIKDIYRDIGENSPEYNRYQRWFEEHK